MNLYSLCKHVQKYHVLSDPFLDFEASIAYQLNEADRKGFEFIGCAPGGNDQTLFIFKDRDF